MLILLGMMALMAWVPLFGVLAAARIRTSEDANRRRFGRVLAFFSLWAVFDVTACATWGAFRLELQAGLIAVFLGAQAVVPWVCWRVVATAGPTGGAPRE